MKFSNTGQEKGDFLIEVTAWTGLTVHGKNLKKNIYIRTMYLSEISHIIHYT
jgi:hypothetical protein